MADLRWCSPCRRLLPLGAFSRDRAQPGGLSYRCRSCDAAKSAAYNATLGALLARVDRLDAGEVVRAVAGENCWSCGTDAAALSVYRLGAGRLTTDELKSLAADLEGGWADEFELIEGLITSCRACAPLPGPVSRASVDRFLERIANRLAPYVGTMQPGGRRP